MIDAIVSLTLLILFLFSFFSSSYFWLQNKKLKVLIAQTEINLEIASKFFVEEFNEKQDNEQQAKDDFIKFLSDSRDWSYTYIEDVQSTIGKFIKDIEPEINYFKEYGDVGAMQPNYYSLKKITQAYEELVKLLPKEEEEVQ
jgi:hypothetical protein